MNPLKRKKIFRRQLALEKTEVKEEVVAEEVPEVKPVVEEKPEVKPVVEEAPAAVIVSPKKKKSTV